MQLQRKEVWLATGASVCLLLLAALCLAWEMAIAPLRPGGSWLALKALPLLLPASGAVQGRRYSYQWASLLVQAYLAEGLVRSITDTGVSRLMAVGELTLSLAFFILALAYLRSTRNAVVPRGEPTPAD
jgi:uncharacterized membrane protein